MLSKTIEALLNKQIAHEAFASYYYLGMASWCQLKGLDGAATFMYRQSEEERAHMLKLFHYINETGGHAHAPPIAKSPEKFKSVLDVFMLALRQEQANTKCINGIVEICLKEKDYATFNFLQWFVSEQHEEEMVFKGILDKIDIIGMDGKGIYMIDKAIAKLNLQLAQG
ncbi:MAG: ferritin [Flavobacteriales bacterium]|nr:ferritin [Flavobacteriales bacterium]